MTPPPATRPRSVTFLAIGVLSIAGFYSARLLLALAQWQDLGSIPGVSPVYIAITGLAWALCAWPLTWGLWSGKTWAPPFTRITALSFSVYYWLEQLIRTSRQMGALSLPIHAPFAAVVNLLCVLLLFYILARVQSRAYFGELNDRTS